VTPQEAIEAAETAGAETRYRLQLAREIRDVTAAREYERGFAEGYARAIADVKAVQHEIVRDAGLDTLRWGPGGRDHFADPRPGDFPGRAADLEAQAEPEPELEIA
jgi:hypothetical protein